MDPELEFVIIIIEFSTWNVLPSFAVLHSP